MKRNQGGLQCDSCGLWSHLNCLPDAIHVTLQEYDRLSSKTGNATGVSFQHSTIHSSPSLFFSITPGESDTDSTGSANDNAKLFPELWDLHDQFRKKFKLGHLNLNSVRYKFGHIAEMLNDNRRLSDIESVDLELIVKEVTIYKERWIIIATYRPQTTEVNVFLDEMQNVVDRIRCLTKSTNIIITGDLNLNLLDMRSESSPGMKLKNFMDIFDCQNMVRDPTCFAGNEPISIDGLSKQWKQICENYRM